MAAALGDEDYTSAADEERDSDARRWDRVSNNNQQRGMTEVEPVSSMGVYERHNADTVSRVPSSWRAASYPAASAGTPRWEPFKAQKLNLTINRCGRVIVMRFYAVWGH